MSEGPVNLNRFRKQKTRAEKPARGDANAARFGQSRAIREAADAERDKAIRNLDNHALQMPDSRTKDGPDRP